METLIFNYFLKKAVQKEQELLSLADERAALLAVVFSQFRAFRRYPSGCNVEPVSITDTRYAEDLFFVVCADAIEHGDNLRPALNPSKSHRIIHGDWQKDVKNDEIDKHLSLIFPEVKEGSTIDEELYRKLLSKATETEFADIIKHQHLGVTTEPLELPAPCPETAMIDRAWNRLLADKKFLSLLNPANKHDSYGNSAAYRSYAKHMDLLLG